MKKLLILMCTCAMVANVGYGKSDGKWYRGNTHAHTNLSDGDSSVDEVIKTYVDYGYDFLLITDHNKTYVQSHPDILIIPGNELSGKGYHMTAFNVEKELSIPEDATIEERMQKSADEIKAAGGITFFNHPNFARGLQPKEMLPITDVACVEVYNGHPACFNWGKPKHKSVEAKWDDLLSEGMLIYAVAADDMHHLKKPVATPGRGWIMVKAKSLSKKNIIKAVAAGEFYASTGVFLDKCSSEKGVVSAKINKQKTLEEIAKGRLAPKSGETGTEGFKMVVYGQNGKVLKEVTGEDEISYKLTKEDKYARITVSYCVKDGDKYLTYFAWGQPVMNK